MLRMVLPAVAGLLLVAACANVTPLESGKSYLEGYRPAAPSAARSAFDGTGDDRVAIDADVYAAAMADPDLTFPARLGLVRIVRGRVAPLSQDEIDLWVELADTLGPDFGEFVPISPFVAGIVRGGVRTTRDCHWYSNCRAGAAVKEVRLAAARQRVDAVLVYEVLGSADDHSTPLSLADLTIVGAFLIPSRVLKAGAVASAILIDVRTGFVYGTARGQADKRGLSTRVGASGRTDKLQARTETAAVAALTTNVEVMARELYRRIETHR